MNIQVATVMGPPVGQYKGVVNYHGILIGLEHVAGNLHPISGKQVNVSYGDIPGSQGVDGDPVDVLLGSNWGSQVAFILQDAHVTDTDSPGEPMQYGEDKIALGFVSEAEARAAHASYYSGDQRKIVGCIVSTIDDVRERIRCPAEAGLPWFAKALIGDTIDPLTKAQKPPPGFSPIPKSKHGGFRKRRTTGVGYQYWYPDQHQHREAEHGWEEHYSAGMGVGDVKAGKFFRIEGDTNTYVYAPDAADNAPEGTAPFVKYNPVAGHGEGEVKFANLDKVVRLKKKAAPKERPRPKRPATTSTKKRKPAPRRPTKPTGQKPPEPKPTPKRELTEGEDTRPKTKAFKYSRAKPGTYLHKLENGVYPIVKIKDSHYTHGRMTTAVDVPEKDKAGLYREFRKKMIDNQIFEVAARFGIRKGTQDYKELQTGAKLGFFLALRSYSGNAPFTSVAQQFVNVYTNRAAQQSVHGGSVYVPRRAMQMAHGLMAARNRAARTKSDPTDDRIVRAWRLTKKDIYADSGVKLGSYVTPDGTIVDQDREELPDNDWRVRGPDGKERGKVLPGKYTMMARLQPLLDSGAGYGTEWMERHDQGLLPGHADSQMSVGTALQAQTEVQATIAEMPPKDAKVLSVLFGLDNDFTANLPVTREVDGKTGGDLKDSELAVLLGLSDESASQNTKSQAGRRARMKAVRSYKATAERLKSDALRTDIGRLTKPKPEFYTEEPSRESYNKMLDRFGSKERVQLYRVGMRTGDSERVGEILDRDKQGKATKSEMEDLRNAFYKQRDADRLEAFRSQTSHHVLAPETATELGRGSDPRNVQLYADEVLHNAMHAVVGGRVEIPEKLNPVRRERLTIGERAALRREGDPFIDNPTGQTGSGRVMSEDRFARFMGRDLPKPDAASTNED